MASILLDTNFIMTCVKQKIDFINELAETGFRIIVPRQVVAELKRVAELKSKKLKDRELAELSLKILESKMRQLDFIDLGKKHVDKLIVEYAKKHPRLIVATLDKELKKKVKNNIMVIRDLKKLEII